MPHPESLTTQLEHHLEALAAEPLTDRQRQAVLGLMATLYQMFDDQIVTLREQLAPPAVLTTRTLHETA